MNVIVADDEKRVCALICALVEWEELGLTLIGTAYDGLTALSLIEAKQPDVLITDIRMPGIDGLELIRQARELQPELQFIIISGHKQFDYAQHAIKYGVAEYLLKPIKGHELNQTLLRLKKEHAERTSAASSIQELRDAKRSMMHSAFLTFLQTNTPPLLGQWQKYTGLFAIAVIALRGVRGRHALGAVQTKILHLLEGEEQAVTLAAHEGDLYLLFAYQESEREHIVTLCTRIVEILRTQAQLFRDLKSAISLGVEVSSIHEINESLISAHDRLSQRLIGGFEQFYQAKHHKALPTEEHVEFVRQRFTQACAQMSESAEELVNELFNTIEKEPISVIEHVLLQSFSYAQRFVEEQNPDLEENQELWLTIRDASTLEDLRFRYQSGLTELLHLHVQHQEHALSRPIKLAKALIDQQYGDELLSLERVSEAVHLNPSYFSGLFKKRMGVGFADYVLEVRMEAAKKLLVETSMPITKVAALVGYRDPKHFSRAFKKYGQIKPNEYRKLYG